MASPFIPSHKRRFTARKVFTDRETPAGLFFAAFEPPPVPDDHRVLVFYGVGGEGKTALARHLLGRLEAAHSGRAGWAVVNFEDVAMRRPAEALLSVRLQLRKTAGLAFPAFDTAFAHWFGRTYPGADIRQRHPELFWAESPIAADAYGVGLEVLKDMGELAAKFAEAWGVGLLWKYGDRIQGRVREWWERRGKAILAGIESLQPDQLLDRLPSFLGADIADAIEAMPARKSLAIIGDTTEAFHRAEAQKGGAFAFRNDRWLRDLVKETPGVLFVLLGRDRLRWAEVEPKWEGVLKQHRLGALLDEDADKFLLDVPVKEPEIRARMVEGAKGLPFYLDLQVDLYESLKNQGRAPEPGQFGGSEPEILGRFLDHLGGEAARVLAVLAHCRRFDEALFLHLGQEFMGRLPPLTFGDLHRLSVVEKLEKGWLSLHALMREALCERTAEGEPLLYEQVHQCLFAWWDQNCQPEDIRSVTRAHELALEEAGYHRAGFEPETFGEWACDRGMMFYKAARYILVQALWESALTIEEAALTEYSPRFVRTLVNLSSVFRLRGDVSKALEYLKRALVIEELGLGPDHAQVGITLGNLGLFLRLANDLPGALKCLNRALAIKERTLGPYDPEVSRTLNSIGIVLRRQGDHMGALSSHERALVIGERALGPDHPEIASILGNLGNILHDKGDFMGAIARHERALAIEERALGPGHPSVARTLCNLGVVLLEKGDLDEALECLKRALAIEERALGPDHPELALTLFNLSRVEERQGSTATARQRRIRALAIFEARLGKGHAQTDVVRRSLATMNASAGTSAVSDQPPS